MGQRLCLIAAIFACLPACPAAAAGPNSISYEHSDRARVAAYAGLTLSLARNGKRGPAPHLRLSAGARPLSVTTGLIDFGGHRDAFALDLSAKGKANLYLGGRRLSAAAGGGWGTGETLLLVAGVATAVLLATQLGESDDSDDDEQCLIEPELCE